MPVGAAGAGAAFEVLTSRYLAEYSRLTHVATPFYTRLKRGRWVQFDGLFAREDGGELLLEAKFTAGAVSLATQGIAARVMFVKEHGGRGIILSSRNGFARDVMRAKVPIEKVLLSWRGMRRGLARRGRGVLTAGLDEVERVRGGFKATSGATLVLGRDIDRDGGSEGIAFVEAVVERWLRRLGGARGDINIFEAGRRRRVAEPLDMESAWVVEDALRGFAPASPRLLEEALASLADGAAGVVEIWKKMWRRGYRGRRGGLKNALDDLCVVGAARKRWGESGLFYEVEREFRGKGAGEALAKAVRKWPAYAYFARRRGRLSGGKYEMAQELACDFATMRPYARSLYNPAKVAGLVALEKYLS